MDDQIYTGAFTVNNATDKAVLLDNGDSAQWVPRSQIDPLSPLSIGETVVIDMPTWLAKDKGFIS